MRTQWVICLNEDGFRHELVKRILVKALFRVFKPEAVEPDHVDGVVEALLSGTDEDGPQYARLARVPGLHLENSLNALGILRPQNGRGYTHLVSQIIGIAIE